MFSGIVETTGIVAGIESEGSNIHFSIKSSISLEAYIDQSVAHNGVCLTIVEINGDIYKVTAIKETLDKTNLGYLKINDEINLERSLLANSRVDGHFVQGHVDSTATCTNVSEMDGSWYFEFDTNADYANLMVNKGSICINGVSLTLVNVDMGKFSVAIIPYTYQHTNFKNIKQGDTVNIEFDILGKYIVNYMQKLKTTKS
jgi:riboflavin synthase